MEKIGRKKGKRPSPLTIRLSVSERTALTMRSGGEPISSYIKRALFEAGSGERRPSTRRSATTDEKLLAELLARIGASSLATNVRVLAHQASVGVLNCDDGTTERLARACREITELRDALMVALGKEPRSEAERSAHIARLFGRAAAPEGEQP